jgi:hypothetical protein
VLSFYLHTTNTLTEAPLTRELYRVAGDPTLRVHDPLRLAHDLSAHIARVVGGYEVMGGDRKALRVRLHREVYMLASVTAVDDRGTTVLEKMLERLPGTTIESEPR